MGTTKKNHVIFLGAGASIPLGFPGSKKLVEDFATIIRSGEYEYSDKAVLIEKITNLQEAILKNGFQYDSESLYSCLEGYCDPSKWMYNSGPFPCSMSKIQPISQIESDSACPFLRQWFQEHLIGEFYKDDLDLHQRIKQTYNRLFSKITGVTDWRNIEPSWDECEFHIFTTNYDRVIETYSDQVNKKICNGMRIIENNQVLFYHNNLILRITKLSFINYTAQLNFQHLKITLLSPNYLLWFLAMSTRVKR